MKTKALLTLVLALALAAPLAAQNGEFFDEAWSLIGKRFYDRDMHGVDWDKMKEKYRPKALECETKKDLYAVINRMIGELKASHCVLVEGDVYTEHFAPEFRGQATLRCGFDTGQVGKKLFIYKVYEGSAAEKAGLKMGDEIVKINGDAALESPDLVDAGSDQGFGDDRHFFIRVREGEELQISVRRREGGRLRTIAFEPDEISLVHATRNSARVIKRDGKTFGYIHIWHVLSGAISKALRDAIDEKFQECDGLILDIRGRGGSPMVMNQIMSYFRKGRRQRWKKPVVCLVDEGSRSAKDVMAWQWKKYKLGPLVGTRTSGAVLGSTFFKMSDGSYMLLAIMDVPQLSGGVRLEGNPVQPTHKVEREVPYCAGKDAILERGIQEVGKLCRPWY